MVGTRIGPRISPEDKVERDKKICKLNEQGLKGKVYSREVWGISTHSFNGNKEW